MPAKSFGIAIIDGSIVQSPTCATSVESISTAIALTEDPFLVWNNDIKTMSYDVYYGNVNKINLDKLAAGTYILLLSDGQKTAQMRVIKQ